MRISPASLALALLAFFFFATARADLPGRDQTIDTGWKFFQGDPADAAEPTFDDSQWKSVSIPHTWNNLDGQDGGNNYHRGPGWYRLHLTLSDLDRQKQLYLKFDAASIVADVYVNGAKAGSHEGAFAAFCFDITSLAHTGDNIIAVRVDNSRNPDVAPLGGDFNMCGGIYRDVHLLRIDNSLSISPLDYASPGIYLFQREITPQAASITVQTVLRDIGSPKNATLRYTVLDARGNSVLTESSSQSVPADGTAIASHPLAIPQPHLWQGRADPYLYKVRVDVYDGKQLVDSVDQPLGLRTAKVDPDKGFFLNGQHYDLHGVNRHQDSQDKGWALTPADHKQDFDLIMEMGCTAVRLAHYQHADYFYSLCDTGGLVVWAELPLVNGLGANPVFDTIAQQQLLELIKQNYNHPSIIFWSLSNELHNGKNWGGAPADWSLIPKLNDLVHHLDPTRITTMATVVKPTEPIDQVTDALGINRYFGWYNGKPEDWAKALDGFHKDLPTRPLAISEYGAGANPTQHEQDPTQPKPAGQWHPEEWQSHVHEIAWQAMKERPWIWGTFLWCMFDFSVDSRKEGNTPGLNDKGMVSHDRKIRKDVFYFYKANWSIDPFVHINSSRFNPRPIGAATVRVYSNQPSVELTVNGKSEGAKSSANHIFEWPGVILANGSNVVKAVATSGGGSGAGQVSDTVTWDASSTATEKLNAPAVIETGTASSSATPSETPPSGT